MGIPVVKLRQNLTEDRVEQLYQAAPIAVPPSATIRDALACMKNAGHGYVLICDGGRLRGIFTERDVLKRVHAAGADLNACVEAYMTPDPVTTTAHESVGELLRKMLGGGYRHVPMVEEDGTPVGVVGVRAIIHYLVQHFPDTVYNLPPDPGQVQHTREGA